MGKAEIGGGPVQKTQQQDVEKIPYEWTKEYMTLRNPYMTLNRDSDYPRFSDRYFRRRWMWEAAGQEGDAAFAITAVLAALKANRRHARELGKAERRVNETPATGEASDGRVELPRKSDLAPRSWRMPDGSIVGEAVNWEAVELLKNDPDEYFRRTNR